MGVQEEKAKLSQEIDKLRDRLASSDIQNAKEKEIDELLDSITDVYIQIKQFVQRFERQQWDNWGPKPWSDIERGRAALESKLSRLHRAEAKNQKKKAHWISLATVGFMALSAIAAAFSAYYAYQSIKGENNSAPTEFDSTAN